VTAKNPSDLLGAGADGYLLKDASSTELVPAIRTVSIGPRFLCKAIAATSA
jgi:DNA-binding NarL/FixJ family response regulator